MSTIPLSDNEQWLNINKLFSNIRSIARFEDPVIIDNFVKIWNFIITSKYFPNCYYSNIKYSDNWNSNYNEHFMLKDIYKGITIEINFNVNNIHALIYLNQIQTKPFKFSRFYKHTFFKKPIIPVNNSHPKRPGIIVQYFSDDTTLFLIDGNHRAMKFKNCFFYDFKVYIIPSLFNLVPQCFDSYFDFISYHLITSILYLNQINTSEEAQYFLNQLETFLQESQNNMNKNVF